MKIKVCVEIPDEKISGLIDHLNQFWGISKKIYFDMTYSTGDIVNQAIRDGLLENLGRAWMLHPDHNKEYTRRGWLDIVERNRKHAD